MRSTIDQLFCLHMSIWTNGKTQVIFIKIMALLYTQVRLWDTESRSCIGVGLGHMGAVGAVAFSKKRRDFFVSGSRWGSTCHIICVLSCYFWMNVEVLFASRFYHWFYLTRMATWDRVPIGMVKKVVINLKGDPCPASFNLHIWSMNELVLGNIVNPSVACLFRMLK